MGYRICVARPSGYKTESPDVGTYLVQWLNDLKNRPGAEDLDLFTVSNARIRMMRNMCVQHAQEKGADFLLFIDPDMGIDKYVQRDAQGRPVGDAIPFFPAAWDLVLRHRQQRQRPGIYAAPYCATPPHEPVHVFVKNTQDNLVRLERERAAMLRGWHQVAACGTGLMLIDMGVFPLLHRQDAPYFKDQYTDNTETKLRYSQDVDFCLRCGAAGIPIYVNFSCWCTHWQLAEVHRPGWKPGPDVEQPMEVGQDPDIPVVRIQGQGCRSWT